MKVTVHGCKTLHKGDTATVDIAEVPSILGIDNGAATSNTSNSAYSMRSRGHYFEAASARTREVVSAPSRELDPLGFLLGTGGHYLSIAVPVSLLRFVAVSGNNAGQALALGVSAPLSTAMLSCAHMGHAWDMHGIPLDCCVRLVWCTIQA